MVFHWSLSDSKSPQVSRTLLSILAVLNNAVIWMVSTRPPTSKSFSLFSSPLVTVSNAPITNGIIVTYMFHSFSIPYQGRGTYPSFHIFSVLFCSQPGHQSRLFCKFSFFLLIIIKSGYSFRVFHIREGWWFFTGVWVTASLLKSQWILLSILTVLNNPVVWRVFTRPPTSKFPKPFNNALVCVPKAPITIDIILTFMLHRFFNSLARLRYLTFFSHSFSHILWSAGTAKSTFFYDYYY